MERHPLLRRVARIVFDQDPEDRLDLFALFPRIKRFFRERRLHGAVRTAGDVLFAFVIFSGLFGPQAPDRNVTIFLSWGIWWPTVVLGWFLFGRMWCGFCPFPGVGRVLQKVGLGLERPIPRVLQKYGVYWSVALFALIIWLEETTGMKESPRETAFLILAIVLGAAVCAVLYPKQAWCRYLCPMGRIIGVGATMSFTEFRPDHDKCRSCSTFACKRGSGAGNGCPVYLGAFNVRNNLDCLVCGHCLKLCDRDSPMLNLRSPFSELVLNKGRFITCAFIIPFLMGSQIARFVKEGLLHPWFHHDNPLYMEMVAFSLLLALGFFLVYGAVRLGAVIFGVTEDESFGRFSPMIPIFVPLSFAGELVIRLNYTLTHVQDLFPTLGRQFGLGLGEWTFSLSPWFLPILDVVVLTSSALAGGHILSRFIHGDFEGMVTGKRHLAIQGVIWSFVFLYLGLLVPYVCTG